MYLYGGTAPCSEGLAAWLNIFTQVRIVRLLTNLQARAIPSDLGSLFPQLSFERPQQLQVTHGSHPNTPSQELIELFPNALHRLMNYPGDGGGIPGKSRHGYPHTCGSKPRGSKSRRSFRKGENIDVLTKNTPLFPHPGALHKTIDLPEHLDDSF